MRGSNKVTSSQQQCHHCPLMNTTTMIYQDECERDVKTPLSSREGGCGLVLYAWVDVKLVIKENTKHWKARGAGGFGRAILRDLKHSRDFPTPGHSFNGQENQQREWNSGAFTPETLTQEKTSSQKKKKNWPDMNLERLPQPPPEPNSAGWDPKWHSFS